jgi:cell division protein FtsW (lipid II flippase)
MISETGVLGCLAIFLITFMILWKGFQSYRRFQDNNLKWLAAGCLAVIFSIFVVYFGGPALVTPPLNMFFWFLGGVLMKLPVLDAQIQAEAEVADP